MSEDIKKKFLDEMSESLYVKLDQEVDKSLLKRPKMKTREHREEVFTITDNCLKKNADDSDSDNDNDNEEEQKQEQKVNDKDASNSSDGDNDKAKEKQKADIQNPNTKPVYGVHSPCIKCGHGSHEIYSFSNHTNKLKEYLDSMSHKEIEKLMRCCDECWCWVCDCKAVNCEYWTDNCHFLASATNNSNGLWYHAKYGTEVSRAYVDARDMVWDAMRKFKGRISHGDKIKQERIDLLSKILVGMLAGERYKKRFSHRYSTETLYINTVGSDLAYSLFLLTDSSYVVNLFRKMGMSPIFEYDSQLIEACRREPQIVLEPFFRKSIAERPWFHGFGTASASQIIETMQIASNISDLVIDDIINEARNHLDFSKADYFDNKYKRGLFILYVLSLNLDKKYPHFGTTIQKIFVEGLRSERKHKLRKIAISLWPGYVEETGGNGKKKIKLMKGDEKEE